MKKQTKRLTEQVNQVHHFFSRDLAEQEQVEWRKEMKYEHSN